MFAQKPGRDFISAILAFKVMLLFKVLIECSAFQVLKVDKIR